MSQLHVYLSPHLPTLELRRPPGMGLALNCLDSSSSSRLRWGLRSTNQQTRAHAIDSGTSAYASGRTTTGRQGTDVRPGQAGHRNHIRSLEQCPHTASAKQGGQPMPKIHAYRQRNQHRSQRPVSPPHGYHPIRTRTWGPLGGPTQVYPISNQVSETEVLPPEENHGTHTTRCGCIASAHLGALLEARSSLLSRNGDGWVSCLSLCWGRNTPCSPPTPKPSAL